MKLQALLRVGMTVADLPAAVAFYTGALGFTAGRPEDCDPALARLLGAERVRAVRLQRGGQSIELATFEPAGASYPPGSRSNDCWFQHCALTTSDIAAAYGKLEGHAFTSISRDGPQRLPARAGGVTAYKFRDPDGHPLELIEFPDKLGEPDGIDHSAIAVADAGRSIAFYAALGLRLGSSGVNTGAEQDAMDDLSGVCVDVVGLMPAAASPHVELLGYRTPPGRSTNVLRQADIAASRLVLAASGLAEHPGAVVLQDGARAALLHDPDGHALLLIE